MRNYLISNIITKTMATSAGISRRVRINFFIDRLIQKKDDISLIIYLHRLNDMIKSIYPSYNLANLGNEIIDFIDDINVNHTKLKFTEEYGFVITEGISEKFFNSTATLSNVYNAKFIVNKDSTLYLVIGKKNRKRLVKFFNKSISRHIAVLSKGCHYLKANLNKLNLNEDSLEYLKLYSNWVALLNRIRLTYSKSKQNNIQPSIAYCQNIVCNLHDDVYTIIHLKLEADIRSITNMLADLNRREENK